MPPILAAAFVDTNLVTYKTQIGFLGGITHPGVGQYILTLSSPPVDMTKLVTAATLNTAFGGQISYQYGVGTIDIFTFDATGVAADKIDFSLVLYDLT